MQDEQLCKFMVKDHFEISIGIKPYYDIFIPGIKLQQNGLLVVRTGYQWAGPPTVLLPCKSAERAALVHDALYQLMRRNLLPHYCKPVADRTLFQISKDDGTPAPIAWLLYLIAKFRCSPYSAPREQTLFSIQKSRG